MLWNIIGRHGRRNVARSLFGFAALVAATLSVANSVEAAGIFNNTGLAGGFRWDAAPRTISGNERSLQGGLRFSVQGGSYANYFSLFSFNGGVTLPQFQTVIEEAFTAWTVVDPATNLPTALSFVADFGTPVAGTAFGALNINGAEIDLLGGDTGDTQQRGETRLGAAGTTVQLTSGTVGYGSNAISGSDISLNTGATYDLNVFRLLLTHEIGHSLGLNDIDLVSGPTGQFIDDNYDGTNNTTAAATLNNSWALLVDPLNPAASAGLNLFTVANGAPGIDSPGVNILMESEGLGGQFNDPTPLTNDDFGGRQFLYPSVTVVPEVGTAPLLSVGGMFAFGLGMLRRRRSLRV